MLHNLSSFHSLQEVCSDSFEQDFAFMRDLGYDQCEMYRRGRFRPATFWKTTRVQLVQSPIHRDRCLITVFQRCLGDEAVPQETVFSWDKDLSWTFPLYVANVHLQAGPHTADRRLRQVLPCPPPSFVLPIPYCDLMRYGAGT